MASDEERRPLPKFGDWDVNDPASAEGFSVIFNKARNDKVAGATSSGTARSMKRQDKKAEKPRLAMRKWRNLCGLSYFSRSVPTRPSSPPLYWVYVNFLLPDEDLGRYGSWVVSTSCTNGILKGFTFHFSHKGLNLVLVGRNPSKLKEVSYEIFVKFSTVVVRIFVVDFSGDLEMALGKLRKVIEGLCTSISSRSLYIEYKKSGIDIQCQICSMLLPKLHQSRDCLSSCHQQTGTPGQLSGGCYEPRRTPHWTQCLLWAVAWLLPESAIDSCILGFC
ncbi:hypothetical protein MLD38_003222 [Melastoma candidum]|uniref:Uncharacterized protein n=1 Tax=Melastoma candidum TaxID=119954 RepID=A0ACB9S1W5_9MYRT|nr:hypothetical protein MLD38_003222 [Melastoma candidum]